MKSIRRLPPLDTLVAFEAAARHMSFTRAGDELNLSQSAVSRQIQQLEERIGTPLFTRRHKELSLTHSGEVLLRAAQNGLSTIRDAINSLQSSEVPTVTVSSSMAIASYWLLPGVANFRSLHPSVNIRILSSDQPIDLRRERVDFSIRYGEGRPSNMESVKLFDEEIFPVCTPGYLQGQTLPSALSLLNETLIAMDMPDTRLVDWRTWLRLAGVKSEFTAVPFVVSNFDLALRAALAGQGVALMWSYVAPIDTLLTGTLIRPTPDVVATKVGEHVLYERSVLDSPTHRLFFEWLQEYAEHTRQSIAKLLHS